MPRRPYGLTVRTLLTIAVVSLVLFTAAPALAQSLSGRVIDPQQRPVASAEVIVLRGSAVVSSVRTDVDGRFGPIAVPAGDYDVIVSARGLRGAPQRVTVGTSAVDLTLALTIAAVTESVVVSAAQIESSLSRVTDSVTVIDRAELDARQTETVADALRLVPGFAVVGSGGRGALTSIFPRGGESDYTLFLVDGIPLNTFGGGFDAGHLATADLDRVEVVRGPQSALYGSGAIGGVVQLITRHGGPAQARGLIETGGYDTTKSSASAAGARGPWTLAGSAERFTSEGDNRDYPAYGGRLGNDDYERWDVSGSAGWTGESGRRIRANVRRGRNDRGFPGPYGSNPLGLYGGIDDISRGSNETTAVSLSASAGSVVSVRHSGRFSWAALQGTFVSPYGESESETRRLTGRYQIDVDRGIVGLSLGAELERERVDNTFIEGERFQPVPVERSLTGIFAESRWRIGDGRGAITAGARLDRIARLALEGNPNPFGARPAFDEDVVWSANPRISAAWFLIAPDAGRSGTWTRLRAGVGTGIKPPTGFEIAFTDNPTLKPERNRSIDVGVEQALAGATVLLDATWFANRYDDLIVSVGTSLSGASRYRTDNIANARAQGVEIGLSWRTRHGVRVRGAWTWMDTEVLGVDALPERAPSPFTVGDPLIRRAPRQGSLEVHWAASRGSVFALVNGRSGIRDLEPSYASSVFDNPGHTVMTLGGALRVVRGVEVFGRITNLFDRAYEDVLGFPAPGRVAFAGVRVAAGR